MVDRHGGSSNKNVTSVFRTVAYELIDFLSDSDISETVRNTTGIDFFFSDISLFCCKRKLSTASNSSI